MGSPAAGAACTGIAGAAMPASGMSRLVSGTVAGCKGCGRRNENNGNGVRHASK